MYYLLKTILPLRPARPPSVALSSLAARSPFLGSHGRDHPDVGSRDRLRQTETGDAVSLAFVPCAILAPSSGLIAFGSQLVADRYSYLSSVPWSIMASYWLARIIGTHPRLTLGLSLVVIVSLSGLSRRQCLTWRDSTSLWTNVLAWDDSSPAAHLNLGNLLTNEGRHREALRHYQLAAKLDPTSPDPYFNSAVIVAQRGRLEEAQTYLAEALKRGLPSHDGMSWLALVLSDHGRTPEALPLSEQAAREAPNSARVQHTHGTVLARLGRREEAIAFLSRAIELDPSLESTRLILGQAQSDLGRLDQAEKVFRDVLRRNPASAEAHVGLGELSAKRGDKRRCVPALSAGPLAPTRPQPCGRRPW